MFDNRWLQFSTTARSGGAQWFSEIISMFGLLFVNFGGLRNRAEAIPTLVALCIKGAY